MSNTVQSDTSDDDSNDAHLHNNVLVPLEILSRFSNKQFEISMLDGSKARVKCIGQTVCRFTYLVASCSAIAIKFPLLI